MKMRMRPYAGEADKQAMMALVREHPAGRLHGADLPYRLASWAFDYPQNVGLWEDGAGNLLAWAVLQPPFWSLDYAFSPEALNLGAFPQILTWAARRAGEIVGQANGRPRWFVPVFEDQADLIGDLERAGFARVPDWTQVYLTRNAGDFPAPEIAPGFTFRPLAGATEVEAYTVLHRAAFGSENMTAAWRARTLLAAEYRPELDMVAVAPDGRLAAFCIGWLGHENGMQTGQIEPLGVHPDFQGHGLGRALLLTTLSCLVGSGASHLIIETDDYRDAAFGLYTSLGFALTRRILMFVRQFP